MRTASMATKRAHRRHEAEGVSVQFDVDRTRWGDTSVVAVRGELDISTAPQLVEAFDGVATDGTPSVVLDLTSAEFIDSTACRVISQAAKRFRSDDGSFSIVCPNDNWNVYRVLEFVGLTQVFDVQDTLPAHLDGAGSDGGTA